MVGAAHERRQSRGDPGPRGFQSFTANVVTRWLRHVASAASCERLGSELVRGDGEGGRRVDRDA
jgi:hypothetical protein